MRRIVNYELLAALTLSLGDLHCLEGMHVRRVVALLVGRHGLPAGSLVPKCAGRIPQLHRRGQTLTLPPLLLPRPCDCSADTAAWCTARTWPRRATGMCSALTKSHERWPATTAAATATGGDACRPASLCTTRWCPASSPCCIAVHSFVAVPRRPSAPTHLSAGALPALAALGSLARATTLHTASFPPALLHFPCTFAPILHSGSHIANLQQQSHMQLRQA